MNKALIEGATNNPGAPKDWDKERDGQCGRLPIRVVERHGGMVCESAWKPTPEEFMGNIEAGCMVYTPTMAERFWRWAGWHSRVPEVPPEICEKLPHWMVTNVHVRLSFFDRLRVLISPAIRIRLSHQTDAEVRECYSASSVELVRPGGRVEE